MSKTVDLDEIMKNVSSLTIDSMLIQPKVFTTEQEALFFYRDYLDSILEEFNESFKNNLQAFLAKRIANT